MKTLKTLFAITVLLTVSGCVKDKFDEPPYEGEDPKNISANTSIASLKAFYTIGAATPKEITDDWIICGIVNGDDKEGNLYKTISIQDSTGGIQVNIDNSYLYNDYPVGRRVFIKCKGLYLGEYSGMVQIGGYIDNSDGRIQLGGISSVIAQDKILKGKWNQPVSVLNISIADLDSVAHQSMLVKLDDVEFACGETNQPYADAVNLGALNRVLEDCSGNQITVRTSGYAKFAGERTPEGRGSVTALFTVYKSFSYWTPQLILRNTNDVQLTNNTRCNGAIAGVSSLISIGTLRALYTGSPIYALCANRIRGVVVSDNSGSNIDPYNAIIQDETGGITIRFSEPHSLSLGDVVEISTSGAELSEYRRLLQLNDVRLENIVKLGTETPIPNPLTLADIVTDFETYESTLVAITDAVLSGNSGKYGGSVNMTDGSGSIILYTRSDADFAQLNYPNGQKTVVGVLQQFNSGYQISIRTTADVY